jgi:hypothetical protein
VQVFFGAAIQGLRQRGERSALYAHLIGAIKREGHTVVSEHTLADNKDEVARRLEEAIGPLPPKGLFRCVYVRDKMIEAVESDIGAAIFEVSTPSLGTGVEIAHAYLRGRMGLSPIPILALYEKDYWPNDLSSMIAGITTEKVPRFVLHTYADADEASATVQWFLRGFSTGTTSDLHPRPKS